MAKRKKDTADAGESTGKKSKKSGKKGRKKNIDTTARTLGAVTGLSMLAAASLMLVTGTLDLLTAGKLAVGALIASVVVERLIVPFGRLLIGPPADTE